MSGRTLSVRISRFVLADAYTAANGSFFLTPPVVFLTYAIQAYIRGVESLTVTQAFTSLALITLLSAPASRLLGAYPVVIASTGSIERIQNFLLTPPRKDARLKPGGPATEEFLPLSSSEDIPLQRLRLARSSQATDIAVAIERASIKPSSKAEFALKNIDLIFPQSSISMIIGQSWFRQNNIAQINTW